MNMKGICETCLKDPTSHSFSKLCEKDKVSIFYTKPSDAQKYNDIDGIIKKYLDPFKPKGTKEKTPAQQARSDKQYAEMKADISQLLKSDFSKDSLSKEEAQSKIANFLRS